MFQHMFQQGFQHGSNMGFQHGVPTGFQQGGVQHGCSTLNCNRSLHLGQVSYFVCSGHRHRHEQVSHCVHDLFYGPVIARRYQSLSCQRDPSLAIPIAIMSAIPIASDTHRYNMSATPIASDTHRSNVSDALPFKSTMPLPNASVNYMNIVASTLTSSRTVPSGRER